jgi:hypothetical protein
MEIQEKFRNCMKVIYPQGSNTISKYQFRDIVRIFFAGWAEALMAADLSEQLIKIMEQYKLIADYNWWPGKEWEW